MGERRHGSQTDAFTGYQAGISSDHTYIHQGKGFSLSGNSGSVAAGSSWAISLLTPANKYVHLRPAVISTTENLGALTIAEASTVTGGTTATALNRNRNSAAVCGSVVKTGATISTEGTTVLLEMSLGSGGAPQARGGGGAGENDEWVLKPGTAYSFKFANIGATTATKFYYSLFWYEENAG